MINGVRWRSTTVSWAKAMINDDGFTFAIHDIDHKIHNYV